ncbi:MAG: hypothetical protein EU549_03770 [Promethearchaeota archaeon]|nr:MAG: hypothetical protein EU549_03770 [Candidatus Lokiarchaeota archaeon]
MKLHRKKFKQFKGDFDPLSIEKINELVDKYSNIAERNLDISHDDEKRQKIKEFIIDVNKKDWDIDPDFIIRGKVIHEYKPEKKGLFPVRISLYSRLDYSQKLYGKYLLYIRDYDNPEICKDDLYFGTDYKYEKHFGHEGVHSFKFAILKAINEGFDTENKLLMQFDNFFGPEGFLILPSVRGKNLREAIRFLKSKDLIIEKNGKYITTDLGKKCAIEGYIGLKHELFWLSKFLREKFVIILSFIALVLLASLKIIFGYLTNSNGLFSDGIENSTDVIKVIIIILSMKYSKDRLGSIGIMIMMLYAGVSLMVSSIITLTGILQMPLIATGEINIPGFIIALLSLLINLGLWKYKFVVGKRSGNMSLISDAKDSVHNMQIAVGVLIGLVFLIFGIYIVDIFIGIVIAIIIIYDGIATLIELVRKKDEIDVDSLGISGEGKYMNRIEHWIITMIENKELNKESLTAEQLNTEFLDGLNKGYDYFGEFAVIGYHNLQEKGLYHQLDHLINNNIVKKENGSLILTKKGYFQFYRFQSKELNELAKSMDLKSFTYIRIKKALKLLIVFLVFVGFVIGIYFILLYYF